MENARHTAHAVRRTGAAMICGYCGHEFREEEGIRGCGRCGLPGRCHMVRCPRCFYENPLEPSVVKKLKRLMKK